jgi:nitrous oxidase accessory protein NosD
LDLVVVVAVLAVGSAFAQAPVYVSPTGNDGSGAGSADAPFQTIGKALASAPAGGQVVLEPGVYKEAVAIDKAVTLTSDTSKPDAVANTIVDATGQINGITVSGPATAGTVIHGLTVEHAL